MTTYIQIGTPQLALAAALLLINILLSLVLKLGLARDLTIAAVRMTVQLLLVGLVLDWVFSVRDPWVILGMALLMTVLASRAALKRTRRHFPGIYWRSFVTILGASFLVTGVCCSGWCTSSRSTRAPPRVTRHLVHWAPPGEYTPG